MIALLGRRDAPTDALEDYCNWLGAALQRTGRTLTIVRVPWERIGWARALWCLWRESGSWKGRWVLVQYTALQWSPRGFSFGFLLVLSLLRFRGSHLAIIFHDSNPYHVRRHVGILKRLADQVRRGCQFFIMRSGCRISEVSILPVAIDSVTWLPGNNAAVSFIPIGPNIPVIELPDLGGSDAVLSKRGNADKGAVVAVFGVTEGSIMQDEVRAISHAMRVAREFVSPLRLLVFGRGASEAATAFQQSLADTDITVTIEGLLAADEITQRLLGADVQLFVRGGISTRRGSAIAGIACGLPIVAYRTWETAFPVTEAGVLTFPENDLDALSRGLARLLTDAALRSELRRRSLRAYKGWFSWDRVAERLLQELNGSDSGSKKHGVDS